MLVDLEYVRNNEVNLLLFYGKSSPFSNFHKEKFEYDGITFSCVEMYFAYEKAKYFKDGELMMEIECNGWLDVNGECDVESVEYKKMGRRVEGFRKDVWDMVKFDVMWRGLNLKFYQSARLKEELMRSKGKVLVEASPYDKTWGVGLDKRDPRILNPREWNGENMLGFMLVELRRRMMEEEGI